MINFNIKYTNSIIGGLNFQITSVFNNQPNLNRSLVINEDLFALIENNFSSVFHEDSNEYKYYHWSKTFHNQSDIDKIIQNLNNTKNTIINNNTKSLDFCWLDDDDKLYLEENCHEFIYSIEQIINFLNENKLGIYVIGI